MNSMYVGIVDTAWFNFIKNNQTRINGPINFWTSESTNFKMLKPGELFLFRLHSKKGMGENGEIVGGAYFNSYKIMSVIDAWEKFGYGNGVDTITQMESAVKGYRDKGEIDDSAEVGCIILDNPFFFSDEQLISFPENWKKGIVRGEKYDLDGNIGSELFKAVKSRVQTNESIQFDEELVFGIEDELNSYNIDGRTRDALVKIRVNQGIFRDRLLKRYKSCCLCNVSNSRFLVASHIKPWAVSDGREKLDVDNGFLMCPNHDALFDGGYISFDDEGMIIISDELGINDATFMEVGADMQVNVTEGNKKYLKYHRDYVFKEKCN